MWISKTEYTLIEICVDRIRSIKPDDKGALYDGFHRLSLESIHSRFFGGKHDLSDKELRFFTEVDFKTHVAIVAELEKDGLPLGVARFNLRTDDDLGVADIAVTVEDNHGRGVGTILMQHLVEIANHLDIKELSADILRSNIPMRRIIKKLNRDVKKTKDGEFINIRILLQ